MTTRYPRSHQKAHGAAGDLDELSRAKLRAVLAEPVKYIEGEGEDASET